MACCDGIVKGPSKTILKTGEKCVHVAISIWIQLVFQGIEATTSCCNISSPLKLSPKCGSKDPSTCRIRVLSASSSA